MWTWGRWTKIWAGPLDGRRWRRERRRRNRSRDERRQCDE
jgi:hypothetical protein